MKAILLLAAILILTANACSHSTEVSSHADIDKGTFDTWRQSPNILVLDVRTPDEYSTGHVDGAINVDYYSDDFEAQLQTLPQKDTVLVYCASGRRSAASIDALKKAGFSYIGNLVGGYTNYIK